MPDFNKGDFTQQGVAGHVNANLRLNEKRLVNIDLTSNEAAEGCTITGTVKDLLNNKVYGIGAGGGGSDIPMCTVTVIAPGLSNSGWMALDDTVLKYVYPNNGDVLKMIYIEDDGNIVPNMINMEPNRVFTFSDPVNIDLSDDWPYIIDRTKDSSVTITVTDWGSGN